MGESNELDKAIKERLAGLEIDPGAESWQGVQARLQQDRRRGLLIFWRYIGTAAAILLAFFFGYFWNDQSHSDTTVAPKNNISTRFEKPIQIKEERSTIRNERPNDRQSEIDSPIASTPVKTESESPSKPVYLIEPTKTPAMTTGIAEQNQSADVLESSKVLNATALDDPAELLSSQTLAASSDSIRKDSLGIASALLPSPNTSSVSMLTSEETYDLATDISEPQKLTPKELNLFVAAGPSIPFNQITINDNNALSATNSFNDVPTVSYSIGAGVEYQLHKRFFLETGFYLNNWQQGNDRLVATTLQINPALGTSVNIYSDNSTSYIKFPGDLQENNENIATSGDGLLVVPELVETYQFVEVPVSMSYLIVGSRRWNWKIKSGLSARFLANSDLQLQFSDGRNENVENESIKNFSLQLLTATSVEYRLNDKLRLNLSPTLQYGLTPVNQNSGVNTYFHQLLIYSGLSYSLW